MEGKYRYGDLEFYKWPRHLCFYIIDFDLSEKNHEFSPVIFNEKRYRAESVTFWRCNPIEFIPINTLKQFPNLNGLDINESTISTIKNNWFTLDLKMLQYLYLGRNNIEKIEENAFSALTELKWITLCNNKIETIHKIFEKNLKLEFINLSNNRIRFIHPETFKGLPHLTEVQLEKNPTINKRFLEEDSTLLEMPTALNFLFNNYVEKFEGVQHENPPTDPPLDLQMQLDQQKKINGSLRSKYEQAKCEIVKKDRWIRKLEKLQQKNNCKISDQLFQNYTKLREIDGDLILEFPDGKTLSVHKAILEVQSSAMAKILSVHSADIIKIRDIKFEIMEKVLDFIYSAKFEFTAEDVVDLLDVSKKLEIPLMKKFVILMGKDKIDINNCFVLYVLAKVENSDEFMTEILKFFNKNIKTIMMSETWKIMCKNPEILAEVMGKLKLD